LKENLDTSRRAISLDLPRLAGTLRERVDPDATILQADARRRLENARARLRQAAAALEALSPVAILGPGYPITRLEPSREIQKEAGLARLGERRVARLGQGEIVSRVEPDHRKSGSSGAVASFPPNSHFWHLPIL
jgi:exodeoxyribonuclease VII large subunit